MKRSPLPFFYALVALVVLGLFVTSYLMNRRQYQAALEGVSASSYMLLERDIDRLERAWTTEEDNQFKLFDRRDQIAQECLKFNLFNVSGTTIKPAYLIAVTNTVPHAEAAAAFEQGKNALVVGDQVTAAKAFTVASRCTVTSSRDLYRVVASQVNLLDIGASEGPEPVLQLLSLLFEPGSVHLSETQVEFFDEWLRDNVTEYAPLRRRSDELWSIARKIESEMPLLSGTRRAVVDDRMFSQNAEGQAFLDHRRWTERWQPSPPVALGMPSNDVEFSFIKAIPMAPGQHLHIPFAWVADQEFGEQARYRRTNLLLAVLLCVGLLLTYGIVRARRKEQQLAAMRAEFVSRVSHELRTPLSLIRLHAESLCHGRVKPEKLQAYYETMLVEAERLGGLVNNVLDFSRLNRDGYEVKLAELDISKHCSQLAESFRFRLEKEEVQFHTEIEPEIWASVDALALSQVLFNLLDNAVKYSLEVKEVDLAVQRVEDGAEIRVADRGMGVPAEMKETIFEEFERGSDQQVTAQRGSGIGLYVTRAMVEAMGGEICVKDRPGGGSVFVVRLHRMIDRPEP